MKKDDGLKQIKELLEIVRHKISTMEFIRTGDSASLRLMRDQQSVMNEKLDAISKDLNNPKTGLKRLNKRMNALWEQVERNTEGLEEINGKLDSQSGVLKRIESKFDKGDENTRKLDKRLKTTEAKLGISPPPELTLYDQ